MMCQSEFGPGQIVLVLEPILSALWYHIHSEQHRPDMAGDMLYLMDDALDLIYEGVVGESYTEKSGFPEAPVLKAISFPQQVVIMDGDVNVADSSMVAENFVQLLRKGLERQQTPKE